MRSIYSKKLHAQMCGTKMEEKKAQAERKKEEGRSLLGQIML